MANSVNPLGFDFQAVSSKYSGNSEAPKVVNPEDTGYMDFDSYLKLLVAEMSNQDFNEPMDDNEVLQQMASYSMLEGIKAMTNQSNIAYATSLTGKAVTINTDGKIDSGIVDCIKIYDDEPYVLVNGNTYKYDSVTDISAPEKYNEAAEYIGKKVEADYLNSEGTVVPVEGEVTRVILVEGIPFLIINDKYNVRVSDVKSVVDDTETETEGEETGSDKVEESVVESANYVEQNAAVSTANYDYKKSSDSLFDELLTSIDSIESNTKASLNENSNSSNLVSGTATVSVVDFAAGMHDNGATLRNMSSAVSQSDNLNSSTFTISENNNSYSDREQLSAGRFDIPLNSTTFNSAIAQDRDGNLSELLTNNEVYTLMNDDRYQVRYSTKFGVEVYSDTLPGISNADCVPHRKDAELYPDEAALADLIGTRMYDVRFINNKAITSRIDTSEIIGTTLNGESFTEIGFSGVGDLAEVVTMVNGTQRVEVLCADGTSAWYYTTGRYTLDEICSVPYGGQELSNYEEVLRSHALYP